MLATKGHPDALSETAPEIYKRYTDLVLIPLKYELIAHNLNA
jgi:hypothetical protein